MLERNKDLAARQSAAGTLMPSLPRALPNVKSIIATNIGCADMRVDLAHVLGVKPGEAVMMRNIGGRNHPGVVGAVGSTRANR
jgi:carbonic anhydrase